MTTNVVHTRADMMRVLVRMFIKDCRDNPTKFTDDERDLYARFLASLVGRNLDELNRQLALVGQPAMDYETVLSQIIEDML
jgi:hypothetical protein